MYVWTFKSDISMMFNHYSQEVCRCVQMWGPRELIFPLEFTECDSEYIRKGKVLGHYSPATCVALILSVNRNSFTVESKGYQICIGGARNPFGLLYRRRIWDIKSSKTTGKWGLGAKTEIERHCSNNFLLLNQTLEKSVWHILEMNQYW